MQFLSSEKYYPPTAIAWSHIQTVISQFGETDEIPFLEIGEGGVEYFRDWQSQTAAHSQIESQSELMYCATTTTIHHQCSSSEQYGCNWIKEDCNFLNRNSHPSPPTKFLALQKQQ